MMPHPLRSKDGKQCTQISRSYAGPQYTGLTGHRMIHKAKDLSPYQKVVIEALLGRSIADEEAISIRAVSAAATPEWLRKSWQSAEQSGLNRLTSDEIDAEIASARRSRHNRRQPLQ
jgi:hypothetical protein